MDRLKLWFLETRPQFLLLSVVLVMHGCALAFQQRGWSPGAQDWIRFVLAMLALALMHGAVDALNDWHDWEKTGIDKETPRTPFSGGSGMVPEGRITARTALGVGVVTLVAGMGIGFYLVWDTYREFHQIAPLLVLGLVGAVLIVGYTPFFTRVGLGELAAGFGLGNLPVLGAYYVITGRLDAVAWISGIPATMLTYNLLLLNEFPDMDADARGGRRHMIVRLGKKAGRWLYTGMEAGAFVVIAVAVAFGKLTPWALLGLIAAIPAAQAIRTTIAHYDEFEPLIPAQGANVMAVLGINLFMAVGFLVAGLTAR